MFRGKESSNRIELSRLVQDLLNFGVLGSLRLWGLGRWVVGGLGVFPHMCTCTNTHGHTHAHMEKIANGRQHVYHDSGVFPVFSLVPMSSLSSPCCPCHPHIIPVIPTSSPNPYLSPHPLPPPPWGWPTKISKNSITLERIKIF